MLTAEQSFQTIAQKHARRKDVEIGKMMSAPGIRYKNKNYAFFYEAQMCFKLGKNYDISTHGITKWSYLSPFKTKPPMTAWYNVESTHSSEWAALAEIALEKMKLQLNK